MPRSAYGNRPARSAARTVTFATFGSETRSVPSGFRSGLSAERRSPGRGRCSRTSPAMMTSNGSFQGPEIPSKMSPVTASSKKRAPSAAAPASSSTPARYRHAGRMRSAKWPAPNPRSRTARPLPRASTLSRRMTCDDPGISFHGYRGVPGGRGCSERRPLRDRHAPAGPERLRGHLEAGGRLPPLVLGDVELPRDAARRGRAGRRSRARRPRGTDCARRGPRESRRARGRAGASPGPSAPAAARRKAASRARPGGSRHGRPAR